MAQAYIVRIDEFPFDFEQVKRFFEIQAELSNIYEVYDHGIVLGLRAGVTFEGDPSDLSYDKNSSSILISTGNMAGYEIPLRLQQYFSDLELALVDGDGNWAVALKKCASWQEVRDKVESGDEFFWPPS